MPHICIISSSIRAERNSHRVVLYFKKYIEENKLATVEILDLKEYDFPVFDNPLKALKSPPVLALQFAEKIKAACGVIIVTPEYNGGYPASLKNAVDLLYDEWRHKPTGIVTVSAGPFAGTQALVALQFTLWKMKAWTITEMFSVPSVQNTYDANGNATDKEGSDKLAQIFMKELLWCITADTHDFSK
jgi:NAD(P)H-dependent FMN reductase